MTILPVTDFRTYFLDRVFTDVRDKKMSYKDAVKITNESGVFFLNSGEATTVLNSLETKSATPTYADMVGGASGVAAGPDYSLTKHYTYGQSSAVSRIVISRDTSTKAGHTVSITYRSNGTSYNYNVATLYDVQGIYNKLNGTLSSVGQYVNSLRNTKILTPYRPGK